jgi:RimJ/RimL family protein N-acetyltransferase
LIQIRLLTPEDAEAYWAIRLEALESKPRAFGASPDKFRTTRPEEMVDRLRAIENGSFIVGAFVDDELVGTAGLSWPESAETRPAPFVWGVYVSPKARGQNFASEMMEMLLRRARSYDGLEEIKLDCFGTSLAAIALYRKFGFNTVSMEPTDGDKHVELHHMLLQLR